MPCSLAVAPNTERVKNVDGDNLKFVSLPLTSWAFLKTLTQQWDLFAKVLYSKRAEITSFCLTVYSDLKKR